jgi:hypothetical protein
MKEKTIEQDINTRINQMRNYFLEQGLMVEVDTQRNRKVVTAKKGKLSMYKGYPASGKIMSACNQYFIKKL